MTVTNTLIKISSHCHADIKILILRQSTLLHIEDGCFIAYNGQICINNVTKVSKAIGIELLQANEIIQGFETNVNLTKIQKEDFQKPCDSMKLIINIK